MGLLSNLKCPRNLRKFRFSRIAQYFSAVTKMVGFRTWSRANGPTNARLFHTLRELQNLHPRCARAAIDAVQGHYPRKWSYSTIEALRGYFYHNCQTPLELWIPFFHPTAAWDPGWSPKPAGLGFTFPHRESTNHLYRGYSPKRANSREQRFIRK